MTKPKNSAAAKRREMARREMARQSDGKFGHQHHSEANVQLSSGTTHKREDHIKLGNSLATALNEFSQDFDENWEVHHNEESQVSHLRDMSGIERSLEKELMGYEETDMMFSIGVANHSPAGKILIDCESASDGHDLSGLRPTEVERHGWLVPHHRSSYEADTVEDAIDWAKGKVRSRQVNDAYIARHDDRSEALDVLARAEGVHVLSAVQHEVETGGPTGTLSESEHRYNYQDVPQEVFDNAQAIFSNTQQHHFGVGADNADELRSAYIVSKYDDEGQGKFLVSHAYGVHSETEAEDGYRNVAVCHDLEDARKMAEQHSQWEIDNGSIAFTNKDADPMFTHHQQGHVMALDINHVDGMIVLRKPQDLETGRHHLG